MRKIIIGFARPKSGFKPFSWLIRLVERTPYSHVYVRVHSDSLDIDMIYQASGAQVNFAGLALFEGRETVIQEFEADIGDDEYRAFLRWAIINAGADYSVKQALGILLIKLFNLKSNPFSNGQKAWVCSELAGYVLSSFTNNAIDNLDMAGPKQIFNICQKFLKPIEVK